MKVIYESIVQSIRKAIHAADNKHKLISYIELTVDEANELSREMVAVMSPGWAYRVGYTFLDCGERIGTLYGIEIKIHPAITRV